MRRLARPLATLGALACAVAAWLLAPVHAADAGGPVHVCLVDASESVTAPRTGWPEWARGVLEAEARAAEQAGRELVIVRFGADLTRVFGPAAARGFDDRAARRAVNLAGADGGGSDLHGALGLARTLARERPTAELVLLSDGSFTGARPDRELARFAAAGAEVTWREPPAPDRVDIALVRLRTPLDPEPGAPLACVVEGLCRAGSAQTVDLELRLEVEDAAGVRRATRRLSLPATDSPDATWTARFDLGPTPAGLTRITCRAVLLGPGREADPAGDALPANDTLQVLLRAGDVRVVLVAAAPGLAPAVDAWVAAAAELAGLQFLRAAPAEVARLLPEIDLLVTFDLAERGLAAAGLPGFFERGGGWLALGGFALLAGDLGPLLPLTAAQDERDRRAVLLLVDGSGSMQGAAFAELRAAVLRLLGRAPASAEFELAFFTDQIGAVHPLPVDGTGAAARTLLAAVAPGGPTDLYAALEPLESRASGRRGGLLVFLLSDGRDQALDPRSRERIGELRARLAAAGCDVVPIAMGPDADRATLELWCAPGAEVLAPADGEALFRALRDEAGRDWTRASSALGVRVPASPPQAEQARELVAVLGSRPLPSIERHLRAQVARPSVEVLLESFDGEPLLALESHGSGAVAALGTLPADGWAPAWASSPTLLAPLLRALARGGEPARMRAALERGELVVRGVPAAWPARVWARRSHRAADRADGPAVPLDLPPLAGGTDPRTVRRGPGGAFAQFPGVPRLPGDTRGQARLQDLILTAGPEPGAALLARLPLASLHDAPGPVQEARLPARLVDRAALSGAAGEVLEIEPRGRRKGLWVLALGLASLALAALTGWERPATPLIGGSR